MKNLMTYGIAMLLFVTICTLESCKKEKFKLSDKIQNIISEKTLEELVSKGLIVNDGTSPPDVGGIYFVSPYELVSPYGTDDPWTKGKIINDYKYKIYDQNNDDIKVDFKNSANSDVASAVGSFVSGSGKKFTIFSEQNGTSGGATYKNVSIISGEITDDGIKDFQYAFVITDKNDSLNQIMEIGQSRIWKDGNNMSETISTYRMSEPNNKLPSISQVAIE